MASGSSACARLGKRSVMGKRVTANQSRQTHVGAVKNVQGPLQQAPGSWLSFVNPVCDHAKLRVGTVPSGGILPGRQEAGGQQTWPKCRSIGGVEHTGRCAFHAFHAFHGVSRFPITPWTVDLRIPRSQRGWLCWLMRLVDHPIRGVDGFRHLTLPLSLYHCAPLKIPQLPHHCHTC